MEQKIETKTATRLLEGAKIALYGKTVKVHDKPEWWVYSTTKAGKFYVVKEDGSCDCPDFQYRGLTCKHAYNVMFKYSVVKVALEEVV